MIRKQEDIKPDTLPHVVNEDRLASRRLVAQVIRAQRIQEAVVQAAIRQLNQGQEALRA